MLEKRRGETAWSETNDAWKRYILLLHSILLILIINDCVFVVITCSLQLGSRWLSVNSEGSLDGRAHRRVIIVLSLLLKEFGMNAEEEGVLAQARRAVKSEESHTEGEHLNMEGVSLWRLI